MASRWWLLKNPNQTVPCWAGSGTLTAMVTSTNEGAVVVDDSVEDDAADEGVGADWKEKKKLEFRTV